MPCPAPLPSDFLYAYLPEVVREEYDPGKAIEAYCKSIADLYNIFRCYNYSLRDMQGNNDCPADLLKYLSHTVGITDLDDKLNEPQKRQHIGDAIPWYKSKGTLESFQIALRALGFDPQIIELWSNYNRTVFKSAPDIPLSIGGAINPAYDPNNTTDGLVKYKTSNIDLQLVIISAQPTNFIDTVLNTIEEVRPVHITLRNIDTIFNITDQMTEGDDVSAQILFTLHDLFRMPYPTCCLYFGFDDVYEFYYDGKIAYDNTDVFFDSMPGSGHHFAYFDNGTVYYFDGALAYDGSNDPLGHPYLFDGNAYNAHFYYDCCGYPSEADNVTAVIDFSNFVDQFFENSCHLFYDGGPSYDPHYFDGTFNYDGECGLEDATYAELIFGNMQDNIITSDDVRTSLDIAMSDIWRDTSCILYDGTLYFGGQISPNLYDGEFVFDGTVYYNGGFTSTAPYTCDEDVYFDTTSYFYDGMIDYTGHYTGPCFAHFDQCEDAGGGLDDLSITLGDFVTSDTETMSDSMVFAINFPFSDNFPSSTDSMAVELDVPIADPVGFTFNGGALYDGVVGYNYDNGEADILTIVLQYVSTTPYDSGAYYDSGGFYDTGGGTVIIVV
jgi:phage tail P2-like protein